MVCRLSSVLFFVAILSCSVFKKTENTQNCANSILYKKNNFIEDWRIDTSGCLNLRFKYFKYLNDSAMKLLGNCTSESVIEALGKPNSILLQKDRTTYYYTLTRQGCSKGSHYPSYSMQIIFKNNKVYHCGIPVP